MRKRLALFLCIGLLSGCTRYTPPGTGDLTADDALPDAASVTESVSDVQIHSDEAIASSPELSGEKTGVAGFLDVALGWLITYPFEPIPEREPVKVKGIYVSAYVAGNEAMMDNIIAQIDETELNAVVIDFKTDEGYIAARVDSELFTELESCRNYIPDLDGLMKKLDEHEIYTIARIVAFKDPYLAERMPDWSFKRADGSLYRDKAGLAWVNPYRDEVWEYLVEAGRQAALAGFDEIQFDYIRFVTDSTMNQVVFDEADTRGRSKTDVVTGFAEYACETLTPLGVFVSADVFGAVIGSEQDAESVGQIYGEMAAKLDYICPMIYPSHYGPGNFGLDHPDLYPYETILGALTQSAEELALYKTEEPQAVVRPWLQDFTASYLRRYKRYGDKELRQQIQAVYDAGYEEWILWNASNRYHYGGLLKDGETNEAEFEQ